MALINNPILRGFNPDPSICRNGNDYFIVTSTFEYYPMLPVYHSKDLASWTYIGSCINDNDSEISLSGCKSGKGVYAPCIRYNHTDGHFYVIATLVKNDNYNDNICFYVKTSDPFSGKWSSPYIVEGAEGIDPSLFFDDDGTTYIIGNMRPEPDNPENLHRYIWIDSIDIRTGKLGGEKRIILHDGAVYNAVCPEGPRLMKKDGFYYVIIAEGGTEHNHAVSVFRSHFPFGPYEINPRNPVFTHRMLKRDSEFNSLGHADIFETTNGNWFASALGVRPYSNPFLRNIGRESFIIPVIWEDAWPVFSPETGKAERFYESRIPSSETTGNYDYPLFLRSDEYVKYSEEKAQAELRLSKNDITGTEPVSFIGWRQTEPVFTLFTETDFLPDDKSEAGLIIILNSNCFYYLAIENKNGKRILTVKDESNILWMKEIESGNIHLKASCNKLDYIFSYAIGDNEWTQAGLTLDGRKLSMLEFGFTGVVFALYGKSKKSSQIAIFKNIKHVTE